MSNHTSKFQFHTLLIQIFIVMVVSITAVTSITALISIRMSEKLFMDTFSITNSKIIDQIQANFESYNNAVLTAADQTLQSGAIKNFLSSTETDSSLSYTSYYNMVQEMKRVQSNLGAYEVEVTLIGKNGRSHSNDRSYWPLNLDEIRKNIITENTIAQPKRLMYQFDHGITDSSMDKSVIVASKALTERTSGDIYGVLFIAIREFNFRELYSSFTASGNDVVILNQAGVIVSSNRLELIGGKADELLGFAKEIEQGHSTEIEAGFMNQDYLILADYIQQFDLYLVNLIDKELAMSQMTDVKTIIMFSIVIVLAALIIVFVITRRLTKSLSGLVKQMSNITKNNFGNYIKIEGSYETKQLGQAFNYMLDELHEYIEKLKETQQGQRNAELAALQMQINPHFLYNTLASIKLLVLQGSKEKASDTINALITLLQNTISNVSETITIEEEVINLRNYVQINHVRYGERVKVNYFIAPDCTSYHLPKLILQPFMENAFFHAFNVKQEGYIYVLVSQEADALICEVIDNGDGMDGTDGIAENALLPDAPSSRQLFSGIGIRNVNERILLLYGSDYGVTITSKLGEGTRVRIKLPLIRKP